MMAIQTNLDLQCPIPWPNVSAKCLTRTTIIETSTIFASPTKPKQKLENDDDRDEVPLLVQDDLIPSKNKSKKDESILWIQDRYFETLWLGEQHSPLISFLMHVDHLENNLKSPEQTEITLRSLLLPRSQIRQRFSGGWKQRDKLVRILEDDDESSIEDGENRTVKAALQNGPARVVTRELKNLISSSSTSNDLGTFGKLWTDAIETREMQLQVLVILCLLRLNAENPNLFKASSDANVDVNDVTSPNQIKRRKRKAEKSHRWTGIGGIFPWQQMGAGGNQSRLKSSEKQEEFHSSGNQEKFSNSISDPESLSKHFESMIDALCLRVATTTISLNFDEDEHVTPNHKETKETSTAERGIASPEQAIITTPKVPPRTPGESPAALARRRRAAGQMVIIPPFGSEGRRKDSKDESDVLQWFCNQIETCFAKSLPRQCGTLRSRCFISTAVTPAKRTISSTSSTKAGQKMQKQMDEGVAGRNYLNKSKEEINRENPSSRRSSSIGPKSSESGLLQRSLLDEDRSRFERTQSFAAAKQKTTWDARQVNVRKRWERSQSVGPLSGGFVNGTSSSQHASQTANDERKTKGAREVKKPIPQAAQVIRGKERSKEDGKERSTFTLVLDTPSKPRPVQYLPIRRKNMTNNQILTVQERSQTQTISRLPKKDFESPWRRSESQPVTAFTPSESLLLSIPSNVDNGRRKSLIETEEYDLEEDDFDYGAEVLDESLRQAFDEEDDEEDFGHDEDQLDIFGPSYSDWSTIPKRTEELMEVESIDAPVSMSSSSNQVENTDENEDEERIIIAKRARISAPTLLSFSLRGNDLGSQSLPTPSSSSSVLPSSPSRLRKARLSNSPQKKILSGRNPFAI